MRRIAIPTLFAALAALTVGSAPAKAAAGMTVATGVVSDDGTQLPSYDALKVSSR
jgi:hypothetical protein